jgi:DKNYY family protein
MAWLPNLGVTIVAFLNIMIGPFTYGFSAMHARIAPNRPPVAATTTTTQNTAVSARSPLTASPRRQIVASANGQSSVAVVSTSTTMRWIPIASTTSQATPALYTETADAVFVNGGLIPGADPSTFLVYSSDAGFSDGIGKDARHVFLYTDTVPDADPRTFTPLYNNDGFTSFAKDHAHVYESYFDGVSILDGADAATFKILSSKDFLEPYAEDVNHVYTLSGVLAGADPKTFHVIYEDPPARITYGADAAHVYVDDSLIPGADPATFVPFGSTGYAKDDKHVYSGEAPLDADVSTFRIVFPEQICGPSCKYPYYDAEDKNHKYFLGEIAV